MICKKCKYEGEFKFCPQCGEKYTESMEEKVDRLEKQIEQLMNVMEKTSVLEKAAKGRPEKIAIKTQGIRIRKRKIGGLWGKRAEDILRYVRQHPGKAMCLTEIAPNIGCMVCGPLYHAVRDRLDKPMRGIEVIRTGSIIRLKGKGTAIEEDKPKKEGDWSKVKERGKSIMHRANVLMKEGATRKDAYKKACDEWKSESTATADTYMIRPQPITPKTADEARIIEAKKSISGGEIKFPKIPNLTPETKHLLRDILKRVIDTNGEFGIIDAEAIGVTSKADYVDLITSIAYLQKEILQFFSATGGFTFVGDGKEMKVKYNK